MAWVAAFCFQELRTKVRTYTLPMRVMVTAILIAAAAAATAAPLAAQTLRLGTIDFPTSGMPAAQPFFVTGVMYLHSFEYEAAARAFREAERLDPDYAMAYWGEAMTYTHPVWNQQDRDAARAALARLAPTAAARRAKARTPREQAYLDAVEVLYGEGPKPHRDTAYASAMERLATANSGDLEAQAFYALSLLGLNQGVRDVPTYLRAGAIAEAVFRANPDHPGAAHYIIHAFDDPTHAPLGLHAARAYVGIAPGAAHAQHMTTHIFLAMGMWDDVASQNEIAAGADRSRWMPGHYTTWLGYAYLQQGRYAEARRLLETLADNAGRGRQRGILASLQARFVIDVEQWDGPEAMGLAAGAGAPGEDGYEYATFVAGLAALRRGDRAAAERALAALTGARGNAGATARVGDTGDRVVPVILEQELQAQLRVGAGATEEALALLRDATALEDGMPFEFGPPVVVKPAHEMLGEILLEIGRPREAEAEFQRALALAPKRALSLRGLARAAAAAGDTATAARASSMLREVWHRADPGPRR
ncbi:MAG: tetratricopeptide repeat protein [Gemmatimonadota bacterium]